MPPTPVTRDDGWRALRRTPNARRRERDHGLLRRIDGQSGPEMAQWF
jgi:hypothetical protein